VSHLARTLGQLLSRVDHKTLAALRHAVLLPERFRADCAFGGGPVPTLSRMTV